MSTKNTILHNMLGCTVLEAAERRLQYVFSEFERIYVSFSGGKDSGVLLNLAIDYARSIGWAGKIGVLHIDYEAQYQQTTDYVDAVLDSNPDLLDVYRICLPIAAQCATSMYRSHWIPWDPEQQAIWVRPMPANGITVDDYRFEFFYKGMWDYEFQQLFGHWYSGGERTACLIGIRAQESFNRWRTIASATKRTYQGRQWTTSTGGNVYNCYPIYDWTVDDVWIANARFGWSYNRLYDLFHMAGLTPNQMRVASPFNDCAKENLHLYRVIDPDNWGRMIGRVDGVNFTGIYGGTTAMGWRSIALPAGHTWKSYLEFLLSTLPVEAAANYRRKLEVSINFWRRKGGALSEETIASLREHGVPIDTHDDSPYHTTKRSVRMDYLDDIDIDDFKSIPTYKRMCICILKNDHLCKYMGFGPTATESARRKTAIEKFGEIYESSL